MNLIDSVAQCRAPFVVRNRTSGKVTALNNTADCADPVARCPSRYVLTDDLTRLCADLAYSKGARTVACADLLHVPAETLWVEWCNEPWKNALQQYGFPLIPAGAQWVGADAGHGFAHRAMAAAAWSPTHAGGALAVARCHPHMALLRPASRASIAGCRRARRRNKKPTERR